MKKFFLLFFIIISSINAQHKFAWISDTYIGADSADIKLRKAVAQINSIDSLSFVLHSGNITQNAKNSEFDLAKSILDELNIPLIIIPGKHDAKFSNSGCARIVENWDDDRFFYKKDNTVYIGLNTTVPLTEINHFKPEDLHWLTEELHRVEKQDNIIITLSSPLNSAIDNWFKLNNIIRNYNIKAILFGNSDNKIVEFNGIPAKSAPSLFKDGFLIVENDTNTLSFFTISENNKLKPESSIQGKDSVIIPEINSTQLINNNANILFDLDINSTLVAPPIFHNNKIYVADYTGLIKCYNQKGKLLWDYDAFGDIIAKPVLYKNQLIISTVQGEISILNANNGEQIETIGFDDYLIAPIILFKHKGAKNLIIPKQTNSDDAILISTAKGKIYCYDLETLQEIWSSNTANGMIQSPPTVIGNQIIFYSLDKNIYSIDASNGYKIWEWHDKTSDNNLIMNFYPVNDGKLLFFGSPNGIVYAVDLRLGITKWKAKKFNAYESIGISGNKKDIFVKSSEDKFYILKARNGKLRKKVNVNFGIDKAYSKPVEWNKRILFTSQNGYLYRINRKLRYKSILFVGTAPLHSIQIIDDNRLMLSNYDGKIILFNIVND